MKPSGKWMRVETSIYKWISWSEEQGEYLWKPRARPRPWRAVWRDPGGKLVAKNLRTKEEARAHLDEMRDRRRKGSYPDPKKSRKTVAEFWREFERAPSDHSRSTKEIYRRLASLYVLPHLGSYTLTSLTRKDVQDWVARIGQGANPPTVAAAFRVLRLLLTAALHDDIVLRNVALGVRVPNGDHKEMRVLTPAEVVAIADAVPERYRALVLLLGIGGLRIGEALALTVDDVDLLWGRVRVTKAATEVAGRVEIGPTKSRKARSVPLPHVLRDALAEHLEKFPPGERRLVFTNSNGDVIRRTTFRRRAWTPALARVGLPHSFEGGRSCQYCGTEAPSPIHERPVRVHDLRHGAASFAISIGAHPKAIQEMLGHSSINITIDTYGHLFESLSDQLAQRMDGAWRQAVAEAPQRVSAVTQ